MVIVGGGAAGLTCAIYAGRGRLSTLLLEKMLPGGQIALSHLIENYPGFPQGISGSELAEGMHQHARRFGALIETAAVAGIEGTEGPFQLRLEGGERELGPRARSVLIATGCSPRRLGVAGEKEYYGRGVSYCATCDGPLFSGKPVLVVGGGNAAVDEALFLANLASRVTVVHRRDQLRADPILQERALANPKIEFLWSHVVTEIVGGASVEAARARHVASDEEGEVTVSAVFIAVGETPQTGFLPDGVERDEGGYIVTDSDLQTSVPGIFAAGDVRAGAYRQIAAAVGEGVLAYRSIRRYLEGQ
ncbi:MAG: thioredoxin-disulfide reductase [Armatimonadota bacterium]|nr:MAG: thioredoxin-disulfide reductase [Armatimonadota bacterium]